MSGPLAREPLRSVLLIEDDDLHAAELWAAVSRVPGLVPAVRAESLGDLRLMLADTTLTAPSLVLVDLHLDDGSAIDALPALVERWPPARLLVISSLTDQRSVVEAIRHGAHGYVVKSAPTEQVALAIREVLAGHSPLTPSVARYLVANLALPTRGSTEAAAPRLTPRETEILHALGDGLTYGEVAAQLGVAVSTVQSHVRNLYEKLKVTSKVAALKQGRKLRYLD